MKHFQKYEKDIRTFQKLIIMKHLKVRRKYHMTLTNKTMILIHMSINYLA